MSIWDQRLLEKQSLIYLNPTFVVHLGLTFHYVYVMNHQSIFKA